MRDENTKEYKETIERNFRVAVECLDSALQKHVRQEEEALKQSKWLQKQLFNAAADRHLNKKDVFEERAS